MIIPSKQSPPGHLAQDFPLLVTPRWFNYALLTSPSTGSPDTGSPNKGLFIKFNPEAEHHPPPPLPTSERAGTRSEKSMVFISKCTHGPHDSIHRTPIELRR